jgi:hypothetical protein
MVSSPESIIQTTGLVCAVILPMNLDRSFKVRYKKRYSASSHVLDSLSAKRFFQAHF